MRHIISILLQNEAGALSRVAALCATRGYNIETLSVAPTEHPEISRMTLVTTGSDGVIERTSARSSRHSHFTSERLRESDQTGFG